MSLRERRPSRSSLSVRVCPAILLCVRVCRIAASPEPAREDSKPERVAAQPELPERLPSLLSESPRKRSLIVATAIGIGMSRVTVAADRS